MRTRSGRIILILLVAACSSGHSEPPFTPSPDLNQSHPFLQGDWSGLARSNAGGPPMEAGIRLLLPTGPDPSTGSAPSAVISGVWGGSGSFQADGYRVHITMWSSAYGQCVMNLRVSQDHQTLTGSYVATLVSGAPRDAGTIELSLPPLPVSIEVYETPELLLVIRSR